MPGARATGMFAAMPARQSHFQHPYLQGSPCTAAGRPLVSGPEALGCTFLRHLPYGTQGKAMPSTAGVSHTKWGGGSLPICMEITNTVM